HECRAYGGPDQAPRNAVAADRKLRVDDVRRRRAPAGGRGPCRLQGHGPVGPGKDGPVGDGRVPVRVAERARPGRPDRGPELHGAGKDREKPAADSFGHGIRYPEAREVSMNKDEIQGKAENIKGRVKEAAGTLTGNERLESEGASERAEGAIREGAGTARRKIGEAVEDLGKKIKR